MDAGKTWVYGYDRVVPDDAEAARYHLIDAMQSKLDTSEAQKQKDV